MLEWFFATLRQYPEIAILLTLAAGYYFGKFTYKGIGLGSVTATLLCRRARGGRIRDLPSTFGANASYRRHRIAEPQGPADVRWRESKMAATWPAVLGGAGLFLLVEGVLILTAVPLAGIEPRGVSQTTGWLLNSGRGVAAVGLAFAVAGALVGFVRRGVREATMMAAGAVLSMIVMLFSIGPGTIFPIVIAFGTALIAGATAVGTALGIEARRVVGAGKS
jgi:hypothetical protein